MIMETNRRTPEKEDANTPVTVSFEGDRRSQVLEITPIAETRWQYLRRYFTTWEGWVGNYVLAHPMRVTIWSKFTNIYL
jgi:hypothetical protein